MLVGGTGQMQGYAQTLFKQSPVHVPTPYAAGDGSSGLLLSQQKGYQSYKKRPEGTAYTTHILYHLYLCVQSKAYLITTIPNCL